MRIGDLATDPARRLPAAARTAYLAAKAHELAGNLLRDFCRIVAQAGVPIGGVSRRAGHARVSTPRDIYAQVTPDMHTEVADRIGALLFRPP